MKPSPKGVALSLEQWMLLRPRLQALAKAARAGDDGGEPVRLSADRQAYVSSFKWVCGVCLWGISRKMPCRPTADIVIRGALSSLASGANTQHVLSCGSGKSGLHSCSGAAFLCTCASYTRRRASCCPARRA